LAGRLVAYLLFGSLGWSLGPIVSAQSEQRAILRGLSHLAMAGTLFYEAWKVRDVCRRGEGYKARPAETDAAPAILGLLTGLNLNPPFVAAGLQASSLPSLDEALVFFLLFFVGTSVWLLPFAAMRWSITIGPNRSADEGTKAPARPSSPFLRPLRIKRQSRAQLNDALEGAL
jgi:Cytochrome C biogenesis protein transmembrane region